MIIEITKLSNQLFKLFKGNNLKTNGRKFSAMSDNISSLLQSVKKGFTDGDNYDSHRPDYTDEVCEEVIRMLDIPSTKSKSKQTNVIELGAGTGKLTTKLNKELKKIGTVNFVATEPMSELLTVLKRINPDIQTKQCMAENLTLQDSSVQGMVAAQSFHWFANKKALDEVHRVLDKSGNLVLLWNFNDRKVDWINQIHTRIDTHRVDPYQYHDLNWKSIIDDHPGFSIVEQKYLKGKCIKGGVDTILAHCSTHSGIQKLDESSKTKELNEIRNILMTHPDTRGQDCFELQFFTDIYQYKKVPIS